MECLSLRDACFHVHGGEIEISVWGREEGRGKGRADLTMQISYFETWLSFQTLEFGRDREVKILLKATESENSGTEPGHTYNWSP